jgi:hypothetical protein
MDAGIADRTAACSYRDSAYYGSAQNLYELNTDAMPWLARNKDQFGLME